MTTAPHQGAVETSDLGSYGICSCGWTGPLTHTFTEAREAMTRHVMDATAQHHTNRAARRDAKDI